MAKSYNESKKLQINTSTVVQGNMTKSNTRKANLESCSSWQWLSKMLKIKCIRFNENKNKTNYLQAFYIQKNVQHN